jgi:hypothetical protein
MMLYLGLTIMFELLFWLVPNMIASAVAAALIGVVMGKHSNGLTTPNY